MFVYMDFLEDLSLWIGGAAVMLAGISVGGLIGYVYIRRKEVGRQTRSLSVTPKASRISGLDIFELPDSMRDRK